MRFEFLLFFQIDVEILDQIARGAVEFSIRLLPDRFSVGPSHVGQLVQVDFAGLLAPPLPLAP